MRHLVVSALAMALAAPLAAHAASSPSDEVTRVATRYADLDLNRGRDARIMLDRLDHAALAACGASEFSFREYQAAVQKSACYRDGLDRAVQTLDAPQVTRLYGNASVLALNAR